MLTVPSDLQLKFDEHLRKNKIPLNTYGAYKKWLRYYLDYCQKYQKYPEQETSLALFIGKLQEKKQTAGQISQAITSVSMYYTLLKESNGGSRDIAQPSQADRRIRFSDCNAAPSSKMAVSDHQAHYGIPGKFPPPRQAAFSGGRQAKGQ